jgi:hypothetical protein
MPIVLTQEAEITDGGQPREKFTRPPSQPIKAGHGGPGLSSQLLEETK